MNPDNTKYPNRLPLSYPGNVVAQASACERSEVLSAFICVHLRPIPPFPAHSACPSSFPIALPIRVRPRRAAFIGTANVEFHPAPRRFPSNHLFIRSRSEVLSAFICVHLRPIPPSPAHSAFPPTFPIALPIRPRPRRAAFICTANIEFHRAPRRFPSNHLFIRSRSDLLSAFICVHLRPILLFPQAFQSPSAFARDLAALSSSAAITLPPGDNHADNP
jgi:hypothetical protein